MLYFAFPCLNQTHSAYSISKNRRDIIEKNLVWGIISSEYFRLKRMWKGDDESACQWEQFKCD